MSLQDEACAIFDQLIVGELSRDEAKKQISQVIGRSFILARANNGQSDKEARSIRLQISVAALASGLEISRQEISDTCSFVEFGEWPDRPSEQGI